MPSLGWMGRKPHACAICRTRESEVENSGGLKGGLKKPWWSLFSVRVCQNSVRKLKGKCGKLEVVCDIELKGGFSGV